MSEIVDQCSEQACPPVQKSNSARSLTYAASARIHTAVRTNSGGVLGSSREAMRDASRDPAREAPSSRSPSRRQRRVASAELRATRAASNESRSGYSRESRVTRSQSDVSGHSSSGLGSPISPHSRRNTSREKLAAVTAARHLVSGNRSRYIDGQYDLDLTYVTQRLIAMAFPAEDLLGAFSTVIRNDLRQAKSAMHGARGA